MKLIYLLSISLLLTACPQEDQSVRQPPSDSLNEPDEDESDGKSVQESSQHQSAFIEEAPPSPGHRASSHATSDQPVSDRAAQLNPDELKQLKDMIDNCSFRETPAGALQDNIISFVREIGQEKDGYSRLLNTLANLKGNEKLMGYIKKNMQQVSLEPGTGKVIGVFYDAVPLCLAKKFIGFNSTITLNGKPVTFAVFRDEQLRRLSVGQTTDWEPFASRVEGYANRPNSMYSWRFMTPRAVIKMLPTPRKESLKKINNNLINYLNFFGPNESTQKLKLNPDMSILKGHQ